MIGLFRAAQRVALWLVGLALLAGCVPVTPDTSAPAPETVPPTAPAPATPEFAGTVITLGLYQEPEMLNAYLRTQSAADLVAGFMEEGLLKVDPDGNFIPALAAEVPTTANGLVSDDGLTVTYPLRAGVKWADGADFTCDDVLFTYTAVSDPASGAVSTTGYDHIESVTCADDLTAVVRFRDLYAPYLTLFSAILPRHAAGEIADMAFWDINWFPVGTGPFKPVEWVRNTRIVLAKNEHYRGYPDHPRADYVVVRIIPSREAGKALLDAGEIDILWDLTEADLPALAELSGIVAHATPGPGSERLVLNLADPAVGPTDDPLAYPHPILGDLRVRQALQAGIDKQGLVNELLLGATRVAARELTLGWAQCDIAPSVYDPALAQQLLDEAGFTDADGDGVRECNGCLYAETGAPLRLKFQTTLGNRLRAEVQERIVAELGALGVELVVENIPSAALFGSWSSRAIRTQGRFDILMYTTRAGVDPHEHMVGYWHSRSIPSAANDGAGFNYSRWVNPAADAALELAGDSTDLTVRAAAYQTVCELVDAELPHIYLYERAEIHATRSGLTGFRVNPWAAQSWNAAEWDKE